MSQNGSSTRPTLWQSVSSAMFLYSFAAGGIAGAVSRTVVSPFERMKIIFQVQQRSEVVGQKKHYRGVWGTLRLIWKEEGLKGYMRGNGANCLRIFPYSAIQFASYHVYKNALIQEDENELSTARRLLAGAMAGMTSVVTTYPLDITRTRLSIQSAQISSNRLIEGEKLPGLWRTGVNIYKTEGGILALYRGLWPTVVGVAPYVGLNFAVYEKVRSWSAPEGKDPTALGKLMSGAVSGGVAQTITYPADVLRRRFQVNTMKGVNYHYKGLLDAVQIIVRQEGVRGLYLGLGPNLLKVVPAMGTSWVTYEFTRETLVHRFSVSHVM